MFPAPWYLSNRVGYDKANDVPWSENEDVFYWRGTTTSGYSDGGVWRLQERQRYVESVEIPGTGLILRNLGGTGEWVSEEVPRQTYAGMFNVHFAKLHQCSERDCQEQNEYFEVKTEDIYEENWKNKFLLDIDGNAFSGRFYTFLQSKSLTLKQALFRQWHEARIVPWVHYIPFGFNGTDHLEIMRFFTEHEEGKRMAREIAEECSEWASQSLRHVDMQA